MTLIEKQDQMFSLIEKYLASNETQKRFCEQESLKKATFKYWLKKYRDRDQSKANRSFVALEIEPIATSTPAPNCVFGLCFCQSPPRQD